MAHEDWLFDRLANRYILYGEWLHKKHSIFYDQLPHYFCEFDIWDRATQSFLSTTKRHVLLREGPVLSVPVLYAGSAPNKQKELLDLVQHSLAKTLYWKQCFEQVVQREQLDLLRAWQQCDQSNLMEGLYFKLETPEQTIGRLKWVRADFVQSILDAKQHHSEQPFIPNQLAAGVDIYAPKLLVGWPHPTQGGQHNEL